MTDLLARIDAAARAAASEGRTGGNLNCAHAGPVKRTEHKACCGEVRVFDCKKRGHEVWHTRCRNCEWYVGAQ